MVTSIQKLNGVKTVAYVNCGEVSTALIFNLHLIPNTCRRLASVFILARFFLHLFLVFQLLPYHLSLVCKTPTQR